MSIITRQFGKLMKRSADDADVAQLISDVKNYDERLDKLISDIQKWQESISQLLVHQNAISLQLFTLYKQIAPERVALDKERLTRVEEWCTTASEMKEELSKQAVTIGKLLDQSKSIKGSLKPVKKVLERRENSKLDYERYTSNAESARKKNKGSEREAGVLAKAEKQLDQATKTYNDLDEHIKQYVPPILDAISSFIPYLLYAVENLVSTFIGQKYRFVHEFAQRHSLTDYQNFEETWRQDFMPIKDHAEQFKLLQEGKAVHKPMESPASTGMLDLRPKLGFLGRRQSSKTGDEISTPISRTRSHDAPPPAYTEQEGSSTTSFGSRPMSRQHSTGSALTVDNKIAPPRPVSRKSSNGMWGKPSDSSLRPSPQKIPSSTSIKSYGANSGTATPISYQGTNGLASRASSASLAAAAAAAAKKKPPPPIPLKSKPTPKPRDVYVIALYKFEPQSDGDLPLNEGDRVKVIKKTDNVEDWWEGEVTQGNGSIKRGFFPANYCQVEG
ncbi:hypothetical protein H072_8516 [Dactylellina haptotyla CBS 200.50]|uniref:SH3 domain-containing protein n=1 Tax=Dactylellina haptotyla (strain CBS 200.50) TaxID=1284197 RepID=S8BRC5_DACHA|nr:hypothetical protein H072_8516 [Dactylellina haptotyla CBS 200.50]